MSVILCTAGYDHTIRLWEAPTGHALEQLQFTESQVNRLAIAPDRRYIAAAGNPIVRLYDVNSKASLRTFEGHTANVTGIGFQKNCNWLFTTSEDNTVKIWDMRQEAPGYQRNYDTGAQVMCATLHPNQAEVLTGDCDGKIKIWDLAEDKQIHKLDTEGKIPVRDITIAADASMFVAANNRGTCFMWSYEDAGTTSGKWNPQLRIDAHQTYCLKCVLSPDVKYLATTSSDKTIKIWDVEDNFSLHKTLDGHQRWVWDCAFSADSAYLVTGSSDKTGRLWELSTGDAVVEYKGHSKSVTCVALNDSAI